MIGNFKMDLLLKRRFKIGFKGFIWEVDEFLGANDGLVIAEIELESVDQEFKKPDWAGKEITGDSRYSNKCLAMFPYTKREKTFCPICDEAYMGDGVEACVTCVDDLID
jgi:CYTH domain-containing protein